MSDTKTDSSGALTGLLERRAVVQDVFLAGADARAVGARRVLAEDAGGGPCGARPVAARSELVRSMAPRMVRSEMKNGNREEGVGEVARRGAK